MVTKKRPKVENERGEATDQKRGDVIGASWIFQSNNVNDQRKKLIEFRLKSNRLENRMDRFHFFFNVKESLLNNINNNDDRKINKWSLKWS